MKYLRLTKEQLEMINNIYNDESIKENVRITICEKTLDNGDTLLFLAEKEKIGEYLNMRLYWANENQLKSNNSYY